MREVSDFVPSRFDSRGGEGSIGLEDGTLAPLPSDLCDETCTKLKHLAVCVFWRVWMCYGEDEGGYKVGLHVIV